MHYVLGDIHNNYSSFEQMIEKINLSTDDVLILLGDIFDRNDFDSKPVELYFHILSLGKQCFVVRGNHDAWLASYIEEYLNTKECKRHKLKDYYYNSFSQIRERLTDVDMQNLANTINSWPLQLNLSINGEEYLFAHAMGSNPKEAWFENYYLLGEDPEFYNEGIEGFISFCGHVNTGRLYQFEGYYLREKTSPSIWVNRRGNVYMMDTGSGFRNGVLSCFCIETKEAFYI
ncbi:Calcineurin-like phosphoesterase [Butyrivibrio fibrisolvens 16/4]|nr:Calcineurin-like phosphoesterase [Butyrivibrio fibrisolvens 16/4]